MDQLTTYSRVCLPTYELYNRVTIAGAQTHRRLSRPSRSTELCKAPTYISWSRLSVLRDSLLNWLMSLEDTSLYIQQALRVHRPTNSSSVNNQLVKSLHTSSKLEPCNPWPRAHTPRDSEGGPYRGHSYASNSTTMLIGGTTQSRPEPSGAVRTPSVSVEWNQCQTARNLLCRCDAVLRFASYSRISCFITWSDINFLIVHVCLVHDKMKVLSK